MSEQQAKGQVAYDATAAFILTTQAQRCLANAADFTVDSDEMMAVAGEDLRAVKALQKSVEEKRTTITVPLNAVIKAVNDLFRAPKDYLDQAEATLKGAMIDYTDAQMRILQEQQRKAEAEARAERERLDQIQRQQEAQAREAAAATQRALDEAAAAAAAGNREAQAAAEAQAAEQAFVAEQAAAQAHATAVTAAVISMPTEIQAPAKVSGISTSKSVDFAVKDIAALIVHVAAHPELVNLLTVDSIKLRAYVRSFGLNTKLPGVQVFEKRSMSARAA